LGENLGVPGGFSFGHDYDTAALAPADSAFDGLAYLGN
jgi:hypothetical protein